MPFRRYLLASRSPRRQELLRQIIHPELIVIAPPLDANEAGFADCFDLTTIRARVLQIATHKGAQVCEELNRQEADFYERPRTLVIAADTVVIADDAAGRPCVLGQPPESDSWRETVRAWFLDLYAGKTHRVVTAVYVTTPDGRSASRVVESQVTFRKDVERWLNWYLLTGEPIGKAGGYALQGAGSLFVTNVEGSLSNVVGLPLEALMELFSEASLW